MKSLKLSAFLSGLFFTVTVFSKSPCQGHFVNPLTDIDWQGLFPMTIGSSPVIPGQAPDTENPASPVCTCPASVGVRVGLTLGYWEPFALVDVTATPYCLVNIGTELSLTQVGRGGEGDPTTASGRNAFYWVHWYHYPVMEWLNVITSTACFTAHEFDIGYLSELDPLWNDSELAFILHPEAALFTSLLAQAACAADVAASMTGLPIDHLFWCMGAQGSSYPMTGFVQDKKSLLDAAVLEAERINFKLHREGLVWDSVGEDSPAICMDHVTPILPKSRYRYEQVNIIPDAGSVHPFGELTATWEAGHHAISDGDNVGFLLWRKKNCCAL